MKIIIIGGSGFIGWKLKRKLELENEVIWTYFKNKSNEKNGIYLDITDRKKVIEKITKINPDIVIHTSAITNMDSCELNEKLAEQVNFLGTQNVVEGCKIIKSKIIFISTSAVFDGSKKQYFENDMTSPVNIYGKTKSKGEKVILNSDLQYLILRIDQPYDWKEKWQHTNSVLRVIDKLSKNEKFHELIDWYNCPTYMPNIVDAVDKLISNNKNGIYHLVGSDFLNRYQIAQNVAKIFNLDEKLLIKTCSNKLRISAKRSNTKLNNQKICRETGIKMDGVLNGLRKMLREK